MTKDQRPKTKEKFIHGFFQAYVTPFHEEYEKTAKRLAQGIGGKEERGIDIKKLKEYTHNADLVEASVAILYILRYSSHEAGHFNTTMGVMKDLLTNLFTENDSTYASNISSMYLEMLRPNKVVYDEFYAHVRMQETLGVAFAGSDPDPSGYGDLEF